MSALGRISGPLLKSNLIRNGIDLAFETDLLYLDVNNQRIGIKNSAPQYELDVTGTSRTTDLRVTNCAFIGDVKICGNTIETEQQYLNLGTLDNIVYNNKLRVDDIDIEGNVISTNNSNSNLELRPNGTGIVDVFSDMNVDGNIHATGNISADGNIIIGDADTDNVTFNAEIASNIIPDQDRVYTLGTSGITYTEGNDWTSGDVTLVVASGSGTLSVPAAGTPWVDSVTAETSGYYYLITVESDIGTRYAATSTSNWTGTNPQTVTVNIPELANGTYNVVQINKEAKRWDDVWVRQIVTDGVNTGTLIVDGINLTLRQGNTYYVAENGDDTNYGDHPQDPFATVKHALVQAQTDINAGELAPTIIIHPGIYTEVFPLSVPVGVTVKGDNLRSVKIVPTVATQDLDAFLLNGETTVEDITVADFYYNSNNDTGYGFRFDSNFEVTSRSPYIKNVTVITKGSTTTAEDPRGFNAGDAGRGVLVDGSVATANSKEASMLFHAATFITPGVDALTATNGARIEWLNSFTYFADRSVYAFDGTAGLKGDGKTRIRVSGLSGTAPAAGQTVTFTSTDNSTVVGPLTIDSVENNDTLLIDGKNTDLVGFDTTPQSITFSGGGTATAITNYDLKDFGAEIRMIGSASVYGNFGLVGDGPGVLVYAIGHNLAYIGNGKEVTNDPGTVIQANEVVESNNAQIRYNSVDHKGDFRVGDLFYVNQETGSASFSVSDFIINTTGGVTFSTGSDTTFIDGTKIETGDWRISGNTIETLTLDANFAAASGTINLQDNVDITGNLDVTGNVTIGGNITIGDEATDTIQIVAGIDSDIIPRLDSTYSLGTATKTWSNLYVNEINVDGLQIRDNYITSTESNADLELRASGTGDVLVPNNDVQISNNLQVDGDTTLSNTVINGTFNHTGDFNNTGNITVTQDLNVDQNLTVGQSAQFEEILVDDNFITTTTSNADLELRAAGTGDILVPNNDVNITNDLTVASDISANNVTATANVTANDANIGDVQISGTTVEATASNADLEIRASGTGNVSVPSNDVIIQQELTVEGTTTLKDTNINGTVTHVGNTTQTGNYTLLGEFTNGNILIEDNFITTTNSNSDLELRASGTGEILVPNNNVQIDNNLTVSGNTDLQDTTITGTVTHVGDTNQTGNYTIGGSFTNGDIQIDGNTIETTASNSNLDLRAAGTGIISIPSNNVTFSQALTVSGATDLQDTTITGTVTHTGDYNQTGNFTIGGEITNGNILIEDNFITTTNSNSDLELRTSGTGSIVLDSPNLNIEQDLTVNGTTTLQDTNVNGTITQYGDTTQTGVYTITGSWTNGNIEINDNYIQTTDTNSNLELRASGTGTIFVPLNDVELSTDLTVNGNTNLQSTNITGTITHIGDTTQTGNYTIAGSFTNGDIQIDGNTVQTTDSNSNLELRANGTGDVVIPNNDLDVTGDVSVTGDTTLTGSVGITGDITQTGNTTQTGNHTINGQFTNGNILITDNFIATTDSNSDLELRAAGTGEVVIPNNDVVVNNDLTVQGNTTLGFTELTGNVTIEGDIVQAGSYVITDNVTVGGELNVSKQAQFEEILIDDNFITTTTSNADLELRAAGSGEVLIPNNDLHIVNDLIVDGTITVGDITSAGTITANKFSTGDITIDDNFITTTLSNSNLELRANGTGEITIPSNNVQFDNDLTVNGTTNLQGTTISGTVTHTGNTTQTGDYNLNGTLEVNGVINASAVQFENIKVAGNLIETTLSNSDLELRASGTGEIIVPNNDVNITGNLTVGGDLNVDDIVSTGQILADSFYTGDILVDDNFITTTNSNSNLELRTSGTGKILIDTFTIDEDTISTTGDMILSPASGAMVIDSTGSLRLPVGDTGQRPGTPEAGQIRYNNTLSRFEGYNGNYWINLKGVEDLDGDTNVTAELSEGANDNIIRFTVEGTTVATIDADKFQTNKVIVDDITIDGNVISTSAGNTDLVLTANGTGAVTFENFAFDDNTITNTVADSVTTFESTNNGYVKFDGTYGMVIPTGTSAQRPPLAYTETGQMRYNTVDQRVEIYDGVNWVSVAGSASGITRSEAEDIAFEIVLSLG
jgi:hypothetical protein